MICWRVGSSDSYLTATCTKVGAAGTAEWTVEVSTTEPRASVAKTTATTASNIVDNHTSSATAWAGNTAVALTQSGTTADYTVAVTLDTTGTYTAGGHIAPRAFFMPSPQTDVRNKWQNKRPATCRSFRNLYQLTTKSFVRSLNSLRSLASSSRSLLDSSSAASRS